MLKVPRADCSSESNQRKTLNYNNNNNNLIFRAQKSLQLINTYKEKKFAIKNEHSHLEIAKANRAKCTGTGSMGNPKINTSTKCGMTKKKHLARVDFLNKTPHPRTSTKRLPRINVR